MDGRNSSLGVITKQWPQRRNRFAALSGFFQEQHQHLKNAAYFETAADQHMDIASGEVMPKTYIGKTLSQADKSNHYRCAYDNYLLAIETTQREGKPVSLDLYFSYLNALELATQVAPEQKSELLSNMIEFILKNQLSQRIKEVACDTKKNAYNELLDAYIKIIQDHKASISPLRFTS